MATAYRARGVRSRPSRPPPAATPGFPRDRAADSARRSDDRYRYGGPWFLAASELPLDGGLGHPRRLGALVGTTMARPWRVVALIALLLRTPTERVFVSESPAGRTVRGYLSQRFCFLVPQNRFCRGVLLLPEDHSEYLRGRRRHALRSNLRRAARAGVRCEAISDPVSALGAAEQIVLARRLRSTAAELAGLKEAWSALFARPEVTLLIARDRDDRPLAIVAAVIDESVCLVQVAVASGHLARWALHDYLVRILIRGRVRYLLVEGDGPFGALGFDPDVHHYQRLLGYELRHLIPGGT